jgi:3-methyl-2-oxobutanoate hydroxymethyltransferase
MDDSFTPRFLKRYDNLAKRIRDAVGAYAEDVRQGHFPAPEHSFSSKKEKRPAGRAAAAAPAEPEEQPSSGIAETIPLYPGVKRR